MTEAVYYCPYCGKPKCSIGTALTVTAGSTVWPYCQCNTLSIRLTLTNGTTTTGWGVLAPSASGNGYLYSPKQDVPQAFQEAFKDGELDI